MHPVIEEFSTRSKTKLSYSRCANPADFQVFASSRIVPESNQYWSKLATSNNNYVWNRWIRRNKRFVPVIIDGLKRLDTADTTRPDRCRRPTVMACRCGAPRGKLRNLEEAIRFEARSMGHMGSATRAGPRTDVRQKKTPTRTATAPEISLSSTTGIIEIMLRLKKKLADESHKFTTENRYGSDRAPGGEVSLRQSQRLEHAVIKEAVA